MNQSAGVRLRNHSNVDQYLDGFESFFELFRVQDGPRDFQVFALQVHQSSEAIRKPILFSVEEDTFK